MSADPIDMELDAQSKDTQVPQTILDEIEKDVGGLDLIENVFDKRVTDADVQREVAEESNQSNSKLLLDKRDVEVKTELNDTEISNMSKLLLVAERYDVPVLHHFCHNMMTLKISRRRQGRREFIQGLHADEKREMPQQGMLSRLFGGGGQ